MPADERTGYERRSPGAVEGAGAELPVGVAADWAVEEEQTALKEEATAPVAGALAAPEAGAAVAPATGA